MLSIVLTARLNANTKANQFYNEADRTEREHHYMPIDYLDV